MNESVAQGEGEIIVDGFAGGGGTSTGIEDALGRSPDIAMNHDVIALGMHQVNHPDTLHLLGDIWDIDPLKATGGRPVGLGWFSPDCKHFSKAKGGKPVEKKIRSLAWVVVHWANTVAPRVIILENVEEFATWGPLGDDGRPCPLQKGITFKRWVGELERLGYAVEWRELRACDYGAPTIRKRLFLIARRDRRPIIWPQPTHGAPDSEGVKSGALKPWRTAAEIIDWSLPCPSIFDTSEVIMEKFGLRAVRPLQPATMARIAKGAWRYVIDAAEPFIVNLTHHGSGQMQAVDDPLATVTAAHRGEKAIVTPYLVPRYGERQGQEPRSRSVELPLPVVVPTGNGASLAVPFIAGVGGRMGQTEARGINQPAQTLTAKADSVVVTPFISAAQQGGSIRGAAEPLHTVTASAKDQNQVVAPYLARTAHGDVDRKGKRRGQGAHSLEVPHGTVLASNDHALVAAHLTTMRNADKPFNGADEPLHTVTAGGAHLGVAAAFLAQNNYSEPGHAVEEPVSTIVAKGSTQSVVAANLLRQFGTGVGSGLDEPARTVMADGGGKTQLSAAFLSKYYSTGAIGHPAGDPLHTATGKGRIGLAEVLIDIPPFGPEHHARARQVADFFRAHGLWDEREFVTFELGGVTVVVTDIGMRMLVPRELFLAQGFPDSYIIDRMPDGTPITKTAQVAKCGNSVCPPMAAALVAANYRPDEAEPAPEFLEAAE